VFIVLEFRIENHIFQANDQIRIQEFDFRRIVGVVIDGFIFIDDRLRRVRNGLIVGVAAIGIIRIASIVRIIWSCNGSGTPCITAWIATVRIVIGVAVVVRIVWISIIVTIIIAWISAVRVVIIIGVVVVWVTIAISVVVVMMRGTTTVITHT